MRRWPTPPLGSLVETIVPARDKPEDLDGNIPWLRIEDFDGMWVDSSRSGQGVTQETVQQMNLRVFPRGTVVCTCSCDMGVTAIVREPLVTNQTFIGLLPRDGRLRPEYLYWALQAFRSQLNAVATGAIQQYLSRDDFRQLRLPVPPAPHQQAIADFLDTETARIDALIAKKRRLAEALLDRFTEEARRTVLLNATYRDPLQLSSLDVPSSGVRAMRLSWIARFGSGTTPEAGAGQYYGGDIPWVLTGDLTDGEVRTTTRSVTDQALMDYSALKVHPAGSLVVAMYGATIGKLGILKVHAAVNQACCVISAGCDLDTEFLYFYLLGFRQELIDLGRGSGQPNISQEMLRSLRLAIPSMDTQREVVASLKQKRARVWRLITAIDCQVRLVLEHRQALITAAVIGELQVPGVAA